MTYLIEPYFLAAVLIISFVLGFFTNETRMESKLNKLKTEIKDLEDEINAHGL